MRGVSRLGAGHPNPPFALGRKAERVRFAPNRFLLEDDGKEEKEIEKEKEEETVGFSKVTVAVGEKRSARAAILADTDEQFQPRNIKRARKK